MSGQEIYFPFGTDDNGLPTEKLVQKEKKIDLRKIKRKEAIEIVNDFLKKERPNFIQNWKNLGISCDFDLCYSTIDKNSQKISQKSFLDLAKKNLVYRKKGPIPWDRKFQTTIAQAELEDKEIKSKMNYIKTKIIGTQNDFMIFGTTRPEMIFACHGFSVDEKGNYVKVKVGDENWILGSETYEKIIEEKIIQKIKGSELLNKKVLIPLINREIKITHDESIKSDLGSGCAYFCSFGGVDDIDYCKRHNPKIYEILNKDGTLNNLCGEFENLIASQEGRFAVMKKLKELEVLVKQENITHIVNVGERSGVEVEYLASTQWFVKYLDKKKYFLNQTKKFIWTPKHYISRLENWIDGLNWDWGFSRQRHFGIPIPVWYGEKSGKIYYADESQLPCDPTLTKPLNCNEKVIPEKDVFDTWFTSASSPDLATNFYPELKNKLFPMTIRPQGHDIINFWLFYTMAKNNLLYEKNPFKNIIISGWVLDSQGKKMSKSKGNIISPQKIIDKFSNDSLRFAASSTKLGYDQPFQEKEVKSGIGVVNKLYNANKFAKNLLDDFDLKNNEITNSIDLFILAKLQEIIQNSIISNEIYDYEKAKLQWVNFFMNDVCNNYLEIVKQRLWNKKKNYKSAQFVLYKVLYNSLKGLSPIMPFITEKIYQIFYKKFENEISIHKTNYPKIENKFQKEHLIILGNNFCKIIEEVRKYKSQNKMSLKDEINFLKISCDEENKKFIEENLEDLKSVCHFLKYDFDLKKDIFTIKIN